MAARQLQSFIGAEEWFAVLRWSKQRIVVDIAFIAVSKCVLGQVAAPRPSPWGEARPALKHRIFLACPQCQQLPSGAVVQRPLLA